MKSLLPFPILEPWLFFLKELSAFWNWEVPCENTSSSFLLKIVDLAIEVSHPHLVTNCESLMICSYALWTRHKISRWAQSPPVLLFVITLSPWPLWHLIVMSAYSFFWLKSSSLSFIPKVCFYFCPPSLFMFFLVHPFLFLNSIPLYGYTIVFLVPIERHVGYFQFGQLWIELL